MNSLDRKQIEGQFVASILEANNRIPAVVGEIGPADLQFYGGVYADALKFYTTAGQVCLLDLPNRPDVDEFTALWANHARPEILSTLIRRLVEGNQRDGIKKLCQSYIAQADDPQKDISELAASFLADSQKVCTGQKEEDGSLTAARIAYTEERAKPRRNISTGIPGLDTLLYGGLSLGNYYIGGGYTSAGKSTLGLNLAYTAARARKKVVLVSFEMNRQRLFERLLSIHYGQNSRHLFGEALNTVSNAVEALPIRLFCGGRRTAEAIAMLARREKMCHGMDLLIIDYVQQIIPTVNKNASRNEALAAISATLQEIAQSQDVAVLALSQLNRSGARENKLGLWSLRDSGALEQDPDAVIFLQRDEKVEGSLSLLLAKNRHGPCGRIETTIDFNSLKITEAK
jgi:replicative DNA helicase